METSHVYLLSRAFQRYTLDVIGEIAFGMEVDAQSNPDEPFLGHCKAMFELMAEGQNMMAYGGDNHFYDTST